MPLLPFENFHRHAFSPLLQKEHVLESVREKAINLANEINAEYWEVSAKSGKIFSQLKLS